MELKQNHMEQKSNGGRAFPEKGKCSLSFLIFVFVMIAITDILLFCVYVGKIPGNPSQSAGADVMTGEGKMIALTFDDGPHPVYTKKLLDGLRERGVHVTFFLIGDNIEGNEDIVKQMYEDGHLIGNHTHSHVQLTKENKERACQEINETNQQIYEITGEMPQYIRPPFGSWNEELECLVPMTVVLWDIDPLDWKTTDSKRVARHILQNVDESDTILLHDVYDRSVDAALLVVDTLLAEGYTFVTAEELLID